MAKKKYKFKKKDCKHKHIESCFVGQACGERCLDCGEEWRSTWQGD